MPRLYLVRHGETTSNVMRRLDTAMPGAALTDFGVRQAARFALENARADERPTVLVSSVARRAQQTAEVVGNLWGVEPEVADGLHEVQVGDLEDRNDAEAYKAFGEVVEKWHHGDTAVSLPGGESLDDVFGRYLPVIDEVTRKYLVGPEGRDVYVVSHGAAIRLVAARLAEVDPHFAVSNHLPNTGVVELSYAADGDADGTWAAHRWGDRVAPFEPDAEGDASPMG
ncbi:putative phosphoglycerate mutase [Gordonia araii NBRC 100433]|uniref:Putative phosphoglycerate mutase n=1 Tax=Gordonia araii NBRC 100433 TaxID=1073574 RepID=G7H1Z2_9ACTN|nr:histidine phosphatase family protein [Gordonia araii]NNG97200.1 histidine phosphatase family protein [Gordonia araii NBRC 100433]GAB09867.1 putative phosphoglycerate mutase [Gordonia araii NBRC 100433]